MTRIKICGITNLDDALAGINLGVDALGFVLATGPRRMDPDQIRDITMSLPPFVNKVGVFTADFKGDLYETARFCNLDTVQLHGYVIDNTQIDAGLSIIKVYRVTGPEIIEAIKKESCETFLMDSFVPNRAGGTGKTFDWSLAREAGNFGRLILSGGLNPDNIVDALERVKPYGVDVSSGVEESPGKKDHAKLRQFVHEVRKWDNLTD